MNDILHIFMKKKLTIVLLILLICFLGSSIGFASNKIDIDSVLVTLDVKDVSLRDVIQQLVAQTKLQIVFNDALVKNIKVSCSCKNVSLRTALEKILENTSLTFRALKDGQVVVIKRSSKKRNIKGYIRDRKTGEALPYANITVKGLNNGTASNVNGYFVLLNVQDFPCTLVVHYIGFHAQEYILKEVEDDQSITIYLQSQVLQGEEIIVTADNSQTMEVSAEPSQIRLSPRQLSSLPTIGEVDIFRTLQLLPGISGVNDGSSGLHVRGGTPDQNLVLFDGMTIFHVDHFFGFISTFNTEAVKDVRIFKGGYPAKFGGKTSSVVELTGKSGSYSKFQLGGSLNLLSGNGIIQVPISNRGAWLLSFRRSYTDIIKSDLYNNIFESIAGQNTPNNPANNNPNNPRAGGQQGQNGTIASQPDLFTPDFYYYDLNSKLSYNLTNDDIFSLSLYNGLDNLDQTQDFGLRRANGNNGNTILNPVIREGIKWQNFGLSAKWSRVWSDRFYSNILAAYSTYHSESSSNRDIRLQSRNPSISPFSSAEDNEVKDLTFRIDNEYQLNASHKIEFGSWLSQTNVDLLFTANDTTEILHRNDEAEQISFYLQDQWRVADPFQITIGLRSTHYGPTREYYYEPRASFKVSLSNQLSLKGAWGEYHQFINRITNENVLEGNRDFWLLANERLQPSYAEHKILGLSYENRQYLFDIEAYHKDLDGVSEFAQRFRRGPETNPGALFFLGTGISKGIEFLAQKKTGQITGWASYTLGKVEYQFDAFNHGEVFPADQDRRHELKLVGSVKLGNWTLASTWVFASGAPYTAPESQYSIRLLDGTLRSYTHVGAINKNRLPNYHRMDISLSRRYSTSDLIWDLGLSIFNLYDHTNVWYRQFILDTSPMIIRDVTTLGFTPTVSLKVNLK